MTTKLKDVAFAKDIAAHYADILGDAFAKDVFYSEQDVKTAKDAEQLTRFYWSMVDLAMEDQDNNVVVLGVNDLVFWMDKLMNCVMGYLNRCGYRDIWVSVSEDINTQSDFRSISEPGSVKAAVASAG